MAAQVRHQRQAGRIVQVGLGACRRPVGWREDVLQRRQAVLAGGGPQQGQAIALQLLALRGHGQALVEPAGERFSPRDVGEDDMGQLVWQSIDLPVFSVGAEIDASKQDLSMIARDGRTTD